MSRASCRQDLDCGDGVCDVTALAWASPSALAKNVEYHAKPQRHKEFGAGFGTRLGVACGASVVSQNGKIMVGKIMETERMIPMLKFLEFPK